MLKLIVHLHDSHSSSVKPIGVFVSILKISKEARK